MVRRVRLKEPLLAAVESTGAVAVATATVALLDSVAPATSLGVVYVLAVMFVAIRRGELPALATAALSVLALNFFFIEPRHRLTIADDHNVVALGVLLVAGFVIARLAAVARAQAAQAALRAEQALQREREANLLAEAASSLLGAHDARTPTVGPASRARSRTLVRGSSSAMPRPRRPGRSRCRCRWQAAPAGSTSSATGVGRALTPTA